MTKKERRALPIGDRSVGFETKRLEVLRQVALAFAEDGYHQTSVGSLASRLGVSKPVLYYYAKNKDDLLYQIGQVARDDLIEAIDRAQRAHVDTITKLRYFFTTFTEIMCSDFGRCFALVDSQALPPSAREKDNKHRRDVEKWVRDIITEGQQDGSIRSIDSALTARALLGAFNQIPRWFRAQGDLKASDVAEKYLDLFVSGLKAG